MIEALPFRETPLRAACELSVVIPAHNEVDHVGRALAALVDQREPDGTPLAPDRYEILVFANNCDDATAELVRAYARRSPRHAIHVAEAWFPPNVAHVGTARRTAMHGAAARYARAGRIGVLAATDADTVVEAAWVAWTLREMRTADAVLGRILVDRDDWNTLPPHTRRMLRDEDRYLYAVAHVESLLAPARSGSWPRHWQRSGPSFAVRSDAYDRVGGVPPVRALEDVALYDALVDAGMRIRHSPRVRVWTSARLAARAPGGFATRVAVWNDRGPSGPTMMVEDPSLTLERLRRGDRQPSTEPRDLVPVETAIEALRQVIEGDPYALRATRSNVASIAG